MSQGKARNKETVIRALKPYFKLGCNIRKACEYAGIPYTTVHTWILEDEDLRIKITSWQNEISSQARTNWAKAIEAGDINRSTEWLTKKEKDEFADRKEITGPEGEKLFDDGTKEKSNKAIDGILGGNKGDSK